MNVKRMTAERSTRCTTSRQRVSATLARLIRPASASLLILLLAPGPGSLCLAQNAPQDQPQNPATTPSAQAPPTASAPPAAPIPVSLGLARHDYTKSPRVLPNIIKPYEEMQVPEVNLINSPRIDQLVQDGKLAITLQDAVELALENSLDIAVQRYVPWFAQAGLLRSRSGSGGFNIAGAALPFSTAAINPLSFFPPSFDPIIQSTTFIDDRSTPINNPFISGTGATGVTGLISHTTQFSNQYQQAFETGSSITAAYTSTRSSSSSAFNFFNPDVQTALTVTLSQQLLNGAGLAVNTRNIRIAKNNEKIADLTFEQQTITTVTNTITAYWELVYARENVKVEEQAVAVSEKLYNDNVKQLQIGTMAPLDVTRAEAQLASDRQNLIVSQTVQLQDQQILKNAISRDPLASNLVNVEIIPTELPNTDSARDVPTFEQAIQQALAKRPDLLQQFYNLKNADIDMRANKNALLPTATLTAQYGSFGLAGNSPINGAPVTSAGSAIVGSNGQPITVLDSNGIPVQVFAPVTSPTTVGNRQQGFTTASNQIFHNQFPDYNVQLNLEIPLRNRAAQASSQHAILFKRQMETQMQQLKNAALLDVRNTYIALEQDRARVEAASKARELQRQTFEAEQKKYQLGASTVYNVILTQRDYVTAQGTELRALADLVEAKANFERATGITLDVNRVTIADAKHGQVERDTLIPGTLHGKVVGTENPLDLLTDGKSRR
ncbi:MAG TPA: TolC family protein [Candidatus Acidoferrum sp.]|nr:TolC family protein [Candidatus Acidoferrum sp.]